MRFGEGLQGLHSGVALNQSTFKFLEFGDVVGSDLIVNVLTQFPRFFCAFKTQDDGAHFSFGAFIQPLAFRAVFVVVVSVELLFQYLGHGLIVAAADGVVKLMLKVVGRIMRHGR